MKKSGETPLQVAVITATDGVRLVAVEATREELLVQLGKYVEQRAVAELPLGTAMEVMDQLKAGETEAAVSGYFGCNDRRWDVESLHFATLAADPSAFGLRMPSRARS